MQQDALIVLMIQIRPVKCWVTLVVSLQSSNLVKEICIKEVKIRSNY